MLGRRGGERSLFASTMLMNPGSMFGGGAFEFSQGARTIRPPPPPRNKEFEPILLGPFLVALLRSMGSLTGKSAGPLRVDRQLSERPGGHIPAAAAFLAGRWRSRRKGLSGASA